MQDTLRDRIARKLETLSDERGYQVLDYVEFLESKYADRQNPAAVITAFSRFSDAVEDKLRAGRVSANTIAETIGLMNRAANVLTGAMDATRAAANELVTPLVSTTPVPGRPSQPPKEQMPPTSTTPPATVEAEKR